MNSTRVFILTTLEHFYNKTNLKLDDKSEDILLNFVNDSQRLLIQSQLNTEENVLLHPQIHDYRDKSLIFYKNSAQQLVNDDEVTVNNINIITLSKNPAESLYYILRQVYSPLLTAENDVYSIKLQKYLGDLESILRTLAHGKGDSNTNIILSIEDELEYWKSVMQKKEANKKEREAAATFCDLFQDVCEEIKVVQSSNMSEMREAAENIGGLLDDVWRFTSVPYSQTRMIHVFDIIGHLICTSVQKTVSTLDIWRVDTEFKDYEILTLLSEGLKVIQTWTSACKTLTETYWPNYALHTWEGKPYVPLFCQKFENRLREIHDVRSTYSQLNKLLSRNEKLELQTDTLFAPFENSNVWMCNGVNVSWETAMSKFAASLRPAEAKIAEKLKPRLHNTSTKQMLYEFMRYRGLIQRPVVKRALNKELETFVTSLEGMVRDVQARLDADATDVTMYQPPEMSALVHQIQWAKQTEAKVKEIQICAEKYLKEFEGSSELLKLATQLLKDLRAMYMQLHEEWARDLQAQAKNGLLQLSTNKPVVEFNGSSKMMEVVFNPRLAWLELEARSLAAMGLPAPPAAAALDGIGTALQHARDLQQVASFHNTLGERMIPSTRPLMLQAALDLSSLVQNQKAVYWDDIEQLANYTDKLKKAVLKLESQNTYLTSNHVAIKNIVEKLMDTELLAKQNEWKKGVKDIRDIIEKVEVNGYKNTELWRSHWDWQLYKALECQYIKTLLSLHKHFPYVKVDLVLRGRSVVPHPPLEELRVQHYHQLRRLVALPAHFVGVRRPNATDDIFSQIVHKHSWLGNKAVSQLEAALARLSNTCAAWTRRAALACVPDLEALCEEHLQTPGDWETNFKACKAYGQAVAKMTFEDEKIEWISVCSTGLRRELEAQTRALWACLMTSLHSSCRRDSSSIDTFVASAHAALKDNSMPRNAKELAEISAQQHALQDKMPEMEATMESLKKKAHMLRTWGGDASVDGTIKEWQKVRELMISHQQMFEHQAEIVKSSLKGEWDNLNTSVEAWVSRWTQSKARLEETRDVTYETMLERCVSLFDARDQWDKFLADKEELLQECQKFNMAIQISDTWSQANKMISEFINVWSVMKEYSEEFDSISGQEWIVFQKKLHLLDEFTTKWKDKLEPYTVVTLFLQQELQKYSDLTTILKYLRGTDFTERHWREVFGLLEMEFLKPDTLIVKDLLAVAPNVKKQIKTLQKLCASASSESAIRSALNDLELWFAGARFTITYYNDKAKRQTPIVKDFKEITAKIEEQQWVVSSLGGGDACGPWEARLRAARRLMRAAHHAQRR